MATLALQPADARAGVVAHALELVAEDRLLVDQGADGVGQLDLATSAARRRLQQVEDLRGQHVAAQDGQVRRRVLTAGFSTRSRDLDQPALLVDRVDDAVAGHVLAASTRWSGDHRCRGGRRTARSAGR